MRDLIERSRAGMEESVRQGWHTGGPAPYGYLLEPTPTPTRKGPRRAEEAPAHPRHGRGPIVLLIFADYCLEDEMGLGAICDELNSDLDRYPPPKRNRKDENDLPQTWSKSQLHSLLRNPKYTGYNVWGRHDKRRADRSNAPATSGYGGGPNPRRNCQPRAVRAGRRPRPKTAQRPGEIAQGIPAAERRVVPGVCTNTRSGVLWALRTTHGGHPPERRQLVPLRVVTAAGVAARVAGHPGVLDQEVIIDAVREFMDAGYSGPSGCDSSATNSLHGGAGDDAHATELAAATRQLAEMKQAVRRRGSASKNMTILGIPWSLPPRTDRGTRNATISTRRPGPPARRDGPRNRSQTNRSNARRVPDLRAALADYGARTSSTSSTPSTSP